MQKLWAPQLGTVGAWTETTPGYQPPPGHAPRFPRILVSGRPGRRNDIVSGRAPLPLEARLAAICRATVLSRPHVCVCVRRPRAPCVRRARGAWQNGCPGCGGLSPLLRLLPALTQARLHAARVEFHPAGGSPFARRELHMSSARYRL